MTQKLLQRRIIFAEDGITVKFGEGIFLCEENVMKYLGHIKNGTYWSTAPLKTKCASQNTLISRNFSEIPSKKLTEWKKTKNSEEILVKTHEMIPAPAFLFHTKQ